MDRKIVLSYIISTVLIIAILLIIDLNKVIADIISFGAVPFLLVLAIYPVSFLFRAIAWKELVRPLTKIRVRDSFYIVNVGFFVNNFLPLRIGEFVRAYLLAKKQGIGKVKSFSTVIVNRVVEGSVLVLLLILGLALIGTVPWELQLLIVLPTIFFAALILLFAKPEMFVGLLKKVLGKVPFVYEKIHPRLDDLVIGGSAFKQGFGSHAKIWLSSVMVWLIHLIVFYIVMNGLGIEFTIPQLMVIIAISNIVVMIPSAPGYIGTYEAAIVFSFGVFGLSSDAALSTAIITHLVTYIAITALGIGSLNMLGISWDEVARIKKGENNHAEETAPEGV